ncbi:ATP-binding protein [Moorella sulfitireducens]|uniref:ATP-binding protein n=1 Tax=Neomoorella sulfitireducens TaxID=2972948 RepID=UPI0021AC5F2E|nr:ATP-binding protein [Moorella sulfitireducens]
MFAPNTFQQIYHQNSDLLIYHDLTRDPVVAAFLEICRLLGESDKDAKTAGMAVAAGRAVTGSGSVPGAVAVSDKAAPGGELAAACRRFFRLLAGHTELYQGPYAGDPWQSYLLDRILEAENTFTLKAGQQGWDSTGPALKDAARQDLRNLQALAGLAPAAYRAALALLECPLPVPDWNGLRPFKAGGPLPPPQAPRLELKKKLLETGDWGEEGIELLAGYHRTWGTGVFSTYWAFRWERGPAGGRLAGIEHPDPIRLSDLVGYEAERGEVVRNTEKFLKGLPAVNILLYGARGTGKSSTVKALLHAYGSRGLRLVELPKRFLSDYQEILKILAPRPQKFIIFIDDLSFEEDEVEYKELKGLLEGSLQVRPANVLVYATSNRRHLVKEFFADRASNATGEVRLQDTVQEKLSLAERFGLTVIFPSPDQEQYLAIVSELARKAGLTMEPAELRRRALQWALYQNGASGRTARQFVDYLRGELG